MNSLWAFLYIILFVSLVGVVVNETKNQQQEKRCNIYWLPFRPAMFGLFVSLFYFIFVIMPVTKILGITITVQEFLEVTVVITSIGILTYWAPTAWFIRKIQGETFSIILF